jgi:type I restriction enzyme M protein
LRLRGIDPNRAYAPNEIKALQTGSHVDEGAPAVIKKIHRADKIQPDPLYGLFERTINGERCVVQYEPDSDLRNTEEVPLLEQGGIQSFLQREVLPFVPDAWVNKEATKVGYEISFTRYFYEPQPLRSLDEISTDIIALQKEAEGMLDKIVGSN